MLKKKTVKRSLKTTKKLAPKLAPSKILTKSEPIKITESLKNKVLPLIVAEFIHALKSLSVGESIRFGKLGSFKKVAWNGTINGNHYASIRYKFKPFSGLKK